MNNGSKVKINLNDAVNTEVKTDSETESDDLISEPEEVCKRFTLILCFNLLSCTFE